MQVDSTSATHDLISGEFQTRFVEMVSALEQSIDGVKSDLSAVSRDDDERSMLAQRIRQLEAKNLALSSEINKAYNGTSSLVTNKLQKEIDASRHKSETALNLLKTRNKESVIAQLIEMIESNGGQSRGVQGECEPDSSGSAAPYVNRNLDEGRGLDRIIDFERRIRDLQHQHQTAISSLAESYARHLTGIIDCISRLTGKTLTAESTEHGISGKVAPRLEGGYTWAIGPSVSVTQTPATTAAGQSSVLPSPMIAQVTIQNPSPKAKGLESTSISSCPNPGSATNQLKSAVASYSLSSQGASETGFNSANQSDNSRNQLSALFGSRMRHFLALPCGRIMADLCSTLTIMGDLLSVAKDKTLESTARDRSGTDLLRCCGFLEYRSKQLSQLLANRPVGRLSAVAGSNSLVVDICVACTDLNQSISHSSLSVSTGLTKEAITRICNACFDFLPRIRQTVEFFVSSDEAMSMILDSALVEAVGAAKTQLVRESLHFCKSPSDFELRVREQGLNVAALGLTSLINFSSNEGFDRMKRLLIDHTRAPFESVRAPRPMPVSSTTGWQSMPWDSSNSFVSDLIAAVNELEIPQVRTEVHRVCISRLAASDCGLKQNDLKSIQRSAPATYRVCACYYSRNKDGIVDFGQFLADLCALRVQLSSSASSNTNHVAPNFLAIEVERLNELVYTLSKRLDEVITAADVSTSLNASGVRI